MKPKSLAQSPTAALTLRQASVARDGRFLVREVGFSIGHAELVCLLGPNGSGKSTILRLLCGLWEPTSGDVLLQGKHVSDFPRREVARLISYVPQEAQQHFDFTVRELVAMGRYPYQGRLSLGAVKRLDEARIDHCLGRTNVSHLANRPVTALSGGELQRVLIARCLAAEPQILLLDEPTANLDLRHQLEVLELCRQLVAQGTTIVLALHDLNAAHRYADRVLLLDGGRVVVEGTPAEVLLENRIEAVFGVKANRLGSSELGTLVFELP